MGGQGGTEWSLSLQLWGLLSCSSPREGTGKGGGQNLERPVRPASVLRLHLLSLREGGGSCDQEVGFCVE